MPKTNSQHPTLNALPKTNPTIMHRGEEPSRLSALGFRLLYPILIHEGLHPPLAVLLAYLLLRNFFRNSLTAPKNCAGNTLFHILIHWTELYTILIHWAELYHILIHWPELYPILIHWTKPHLNTLQSATSQIRFVSQSESSITSPECSRLGWRSLLGSRLQSARYSLS